MRYADLIALRDQYTLGIKALELSTSEALDWAFVFSRMDTIIGTHPEMEKLDPMAFRALLDLLIDRFSYLIEFPFFYTKNSANLTNLFCIALAKTLQRQLLPDQDALAVLAHSMQETLALAKSSQLVFTTDIVERISEFYAGLASDLKNVSGKTWVHFLIPTLTDNSHAINEQTCLTDFILSKDGQRLIAILPGMDALSALTHNQFFDYKSRSESHKELSSCDNVNPFVKEYVDAITARYHFKKSGISLNGVLNKLQTALMQSTLYPCNESISTHPAILHFIQLYNAMTPETQQKLQGLPCLDEVETKDHGYAEFRKYTRDFSWVLENVLKKPNYELSMNRAASMIGQLAFHVNDAQCDFVGNFGLAVYEQAVTDARHWLANELEQVRSGKHPRKSNLPEWQEKKLLPVMLEKFTLNDLEQSIAKLRSIKFLSVKGNSRTFLWAESGELYLTGRYNHDNCNHFIKFVNKMYEHPIEMKGVSGNIKEVVTGMFHTVILNHAGEVYVYGSNFAGQLGLGDYDDRDLPTKITSMTEEITQVAIGWTSTAVLTKSGKVYVCGENTFGQIGLLDCPKTCHFTELKIKAPTTLNDVKITQIASHARQIFLITENGELYTSGYNSAGQLGLKNFSDQKQLIKVPLEGEKVAQVATAHYSTAIVTQSGQLYVCGSYKNMDALAPTDSSTSDSTLRKIEMDNVAKVTFGIDCNLQVTKTDGQSSVFGSKDKAFQPAANSSPPQVFIPSACSNALQMLEVKLKALAPPSVATANSAMFANSRVNTGGEFNVAVSKRVGVGIV